MGDDMNPFAAAGWYLVGIAVIFVFILIVDGIVG